MATNLFIGGLAYTVTDDQLRELFETVGTVQSAKVIVDKYSNRSKGLVLSKWAAMTKLKKLSLI